MASPQLNLAVTELTAAMVHGLSRIDTEEQPPTRATLDWVGQSLAQINMIVQKAARRDLRAVHEFLSERFDPAFGQAFTPARAPTPIQARLRREFLDQIKDQVLSERFADHTAEVERRWRADAEARVMAYAQAAGFVVTSWIVTGLAVRYFEISSLPALWASMFGGAFMGPGIALLAVWKDLPLTRRFRNNMNVVLNPVLNCANHLLESTPAPAPVLTLSAGRIGRSKHVDHVGRGARRRPPRSTGSY